MNEHKAIEKPDFTLSVPRCPECGGKPNAVLEMLYAWAEIDDDGNYTGSTKVLWDTQEVDVADKQIQVQCGQCGCSWNTEEEV